MNDMRDAAGGVALLAEGVDRNHNAAFDLGLVPVSPSSRRAWIEIAHPQIVRAGFPVALLAEGVDRNATIAIILTGLCVALLAEGVDRNHTGRGAYDNAVGRPPRGGRG